MRVLQNNNSIGPFNLSSAMFSLNKSSATKREKPALKTSSRSFKRDCEWSMVAGQTAGEIGKTIGVWGTYKNID